MRSRRVGDSWSYLARTHIEHPMNCSPPGPSAHGILQEYCSGLPCPPPADLLNPGTEPTSLTSPALAGRFFTTSASWKAQGEGSGRMSWSFSTSLYYPWLLCYLRSWARQHHEQSSQREGFCPQSLCAHNLPSSIPLPVDSWAAGRQLGPQPTPSFLKLYASYGHSI